MTYEASKIELLKRHDLFKLDRKVLPVCFLCNKVPEKGFRSGFFLRGIFICKECEQELIKSKPEGREEEYMLTIAKLRYILFNENKPRYI